MISLIHSEVRKESSRERKLVMNFNMRICPKNVHKNRMEITLARQNNEGTIKKSNNQPVKCKEWMKDRIN